MKTIKSEGYTYLVNTKEIPKPGDYGYLSSTYNNGRKGVVLKVLNERTYPTAKEEGDLDSYENVWNVEIINKSEIGKNYHDKKVHYATSYHLSHFNSGGKIIETDNPNIKL